MKAKIVEKINVKINPNADKPQISLRTIEETVETLLGLKKEDEAEDEFVERMFPIIETMAGNIRNDVSSFANKEKERLAEEYKKRKTKTEDPEEPKEPEAKEDEMPEWASKMLDKLEGIDKWRSDLDAAKTAEQIRKEMIDEASETYSEEVVDVASLNFDFTGEDAQSRFQETLSTIAKKFNHKPKTGKSEKPADYSSVVERYKENTGI